MLAVCLLYVSLWSIIFVCVMFMCSVMLSICRCSLVLYSAGSDVKGVQVDS